MDYSFHHDVQFGTFFCQHLLTNKPCIFDLQLTEGWKCRRDWVKHNGVPDNEFLSRNFGGALVPIVTSQIVGTSYSGHEVVEKPFSEFLDHITSLNGDACNSDECWYLKDWHFAHAFPSTNVYDVPVYFCSDWMNEYWDVKGDKKQKDYRFLYYGAKNSWTPFHADVLRSFSWSANICGRKLWYLVPPGNESVFARESYSKSLIPDIREKRDFFQKCGVIEVVQEAGQVIFVPSNWHHQVHNLENTISINHNWFNAANLFCVWQYIRSRLKEVEGEIEDTKDILQEQWHKQCQAVLKADIGIDYEEFAVLLQTIVKRRCRHVSGISNLELERAMAILKCPKHQRIHRILGQEDTSIECTKLLEERILQNCICESSRTNLCTSCTNFLFINDLVTCKAFMEMFRKDFENANLFFDFTVDLLHDCV